MRNSRRARTALLAVVAVPALALPLGGCGTGGQEAARTAPVATAPSTGAAVPAPRPEPSGDAERSPAPPRDGTDGGAGDGGGRAEREPGGAESGAGVQVADSDLGRVLTDLSGRTLYAFTKDKDRTSACGAECVAVWPALTAPSAVDAGEGIDSDLLRGTERTGGVIQATYGEWPLYYYVGDVAPGDVNGQGVDGEWFAVAPDGKLIRTTTP
ncbi:hypothetical protein ACLGI4_03230 [Streptomyces sp. HMX112]|uniref:COG4315 family predicted lipoprotein n=1 Tax=Streptomyces sp. HMX112 TaxID=3390850 RepID=UPI003A8026E3